MDISDTAASENKPVDVCVDRDETGAMEEETEGDKEDKERNEREKVEEVKDKEVEEVEKDCADAELAV